MRNAANTLISVMLEVGGKDAFIVLEDVDVPPVGVHPVILTTWLE